jgi:biotin carboxylase
MSYYNASVVDVNSEVVRLAPGVNLTINGSVVKIWLQGFVAIFQEAVEFCEKHGVPVMFKAAYGGGGRGMRAVFKMEDVAEQFERARQVTVYFYRCMVATVKLFLQSGDFL